MKPRFAEIVIIGGGQAGLAMSYCLTAQGRRRQAGDQTARIGMRGAIKVPGIQAFHHAAAIHYQNAVAEARHHRQVMADQD